MSTTKPAAAKTAARPKRPTARSFSSAAGNFISKNAPSLESTVMAALRTAQTGRYAFKAAGKLVENQAMGGQPLSPAPKSKSLFAYRPIDKIKLAALGAQSMRLRNELKAQGLLTTETVRMRFKGEGDRRFVVEYTPDPSGESAVLLRISPASSAPIPNAKEEMLTTQQAADRLNVSRPYVAQLVDGGKFSGVERTQAGHRRIPVAEVERVRMEMKQTMRQAIESIEESTVDLRQRELDAARAKSKKRWVSKSSK